MTLLQLDGERQTRQSAAEHDDVVLLPVVLVSMKYTTVWIGTISAVCCENKLPMLVVELPGVPLAAWAIVAT